MYKSINSWSFPGGMEVLDMMKMAKAHGFEGFEPAIAATGKLSLESKDCEWTELREQAADVGIRLTSLASGLSWGTSPTSNDKSVRDLAASQLRRQLECAKLIGVDAVLWVPGTVGKGFWGGEDFVDYGDAYDRTVENLNALKGDAEALGVTIAIENVWNNFLLSPLELRNLIDEIASPRVGAYLDIGNVIKFGFPEMWVKALGHRISRIHVKDYKRGVGTLDGFVDLLAGDVNFPAVIAELKAAGYDGPLTAEMSASGCYPEDIVFRTARALEKVLGER